MTTNLIVKDVPKKIAERTHTYMDKYMLSLNDAFNEAVRAYHPLSHDLALAFLAGDFREYIPSAYLPEYLDFEKYPLYSL